MYADHSLWLAQEIVTENFFLCLLRQKGKGGGKFRMVQNGGLSADGKKIFFKLLRLGKLDKLLIHHFDSRGRRLRIHGDAAFCVRAKHHLPGKPRSVSVTLSLIHI